MSSRPERKPKPPPSPVQYPDFLGAAGSDEEALRLIAFAVRDDHGVSAETRMKAALIAGEMSAAVARGEGDLALEVRCSSMYRHKPCRQVLAQVWGFADSPVHYVRTKIRTGPTRREVVLLQAMQQHEQGMPNVAKATEALADAEVMDHDFVLEAPSATEDAVQVACPRHGFVHVDRIWLFSETTSTRRSAVVDVAASLL